MTPVIVWFRRDLRLVDNPALNEALSLGWPVLPVFILDDKGEGKWAAGAASRWWLHHSLAALADSLKRRGSRLFLARGTSAELLAQLVRETGAKHVFWNRCYEPALIARDTEIKRRLTAAGVEARSFNGSLLYEPQEIKNKQGGPFQVFTPYWRHCLQLRDPAAPIPISTDAFPAVPVGALRSLALGELELLPKQDWAQGFGRRWSPGENGALARLEQFLDASRDRYDEDRDYPAIDGTSGLSAALHFGELGPRQIVAALRKRAAKTGVFPASPGEKRYLDELGWREFSHHLLYHFPETTDKALRPDFEKFPWAKDPGGRKLKAWQQGRTGYPIVDAGMRQLWSEGWMHNRVRMIVASFLVKHLRLDWRHGAAWFWDTLVDADLAANSLGWQWSAGCGADAAPYFRIFNPVLQAEKFDEQGAYVRRWVPELGTMPVTWLHQPWAAPAAVLAASGLKLGKDYPMPLVDHAKAREEALAAFKTLKNTREKP